MKEYTPLKRNINEKELDAKIEQLADLITDALMEETRSRVMRGIQQNRSPEAA